MELTIVAALKWIKSEFGGRDHKPVVGLRPTIRFQRYIEDWLKLAWDIEIIELDLDNQSWEGTAKMKFVRNCSQENNYFKDGELVELLDAYRVIAVGRIIEILDE